MERIPFPNKPQKTIRTFSRPTWRIPHTQVEKVVEVPKIIEEEIVEEYDVVRKVQKYVEVDKVEKVKKYVYVEEVKEVEKIIEVNEL